MLVGSASPGSPFEEHWQALLPHLSCSAFTHKWDLLPLQQARCASRGKAMPMKRRRTNGPKRLKRPLGLARQEETRSGRYPNPQASARPEQRMRKARLPRESSGSGGPSWMSRLKMKIPRGISVAASKSEKILVTRIALGDVERS